MRSRLVGLQVVIGLCAMGLLIWELGWDLTLHHASISESITWGLVILALVAEAGLAWYQFPRSKYKRYALIVMLVVLAAGRFGLEHPLRDLFGGYVSPRTAALSALLAVQVTLLVPLFFRFIRVTRIAIFHRLSPGVLFVGSFALATGVGTLMLKTPNATVDGISWLDAWFTSTSAICVTGLIVVDTEHAFTPHGQFVILFLIQCGGLGIMTLTYFLALVLGQGISLRDTANLGELFSDENLGAMGSFVARIVVLTLVVELAGALFIHWSWRDLELSNTQRWWSSVFHSISAFCNAGFSTFSEGLARSDLVENRPFQCVIMLLIITGGIGFAVLEDLPRLARRLLARTLRIFLPRSRFVSRLYFGKRVKLHTKLALISTVSLLLGGAVLLLWVAAEPVSSKGIWDAVFNSVTTRTAGFNINSFASYNFAGVVVLCFLMFIGGSPGGTAGGVKTTTFAVALGELGRLIRGHPSLHLFQRRIPKDIVERTSATIVLSVLWVVAMIFLISFTHPELDPTDVVFECFSAFGTVGISRGITGELNTFGKVIIIVSMFAGRVGLLTLVLTIGGCRSPRRYELMEGHLPLN